MLHSLWVLTASGDLAANLAVSLARVLAGLAIGVSLGSALALTAGLSRLGEGLVDPPLQMLRTLPALALTPLFIVWFGIGETPKVALDRPGRHLSHLPEPVQRHPRRGREAGRSGPPPWASANGTLIREVVLPGALPSFLVGFRYALSVSVLMLVVAESVNASAGLGYLINNARDYLRTDVIVVCLVLYALLGLLADAFVRFNERRALAWRPAYIQKPPDRNHQGPACPAADAHPELLPAAADRGDARFPKPAVRIRGFTRRFGENSILRELDLDIAPGEFVALLGRSGSGKTTLLRTLAGLDSAEGQDVRIPAARAVVFQEPRLLPWKRVWRNVALGLKVGDPRALAEAALTEVGLGHRLDAWPATLSGGEAQRVALARALVREPRLPAAGRALRGS